MNFDYMPKVPPDSKSKTILHIDDDKNILDIVKLLLREKDYNIISDIHGSKAMDLVSEHRPDLIILDIMMPEINGFELIEKFRSNEETKTIPIVVLSVSDVAEKCLALGANIFLAKPMNEMKLTNAIEKLIH